MATSNSPWSVKGVPQEVRSAAKIAARRAGMTIGQWLSRAVMDAAKQDVTGTQSVQAAPQETQTLPAIRESEQVQAGLARLERDARALHEVVNGVQQMKADLADRLADLDSRLADAPGADVAALEKRLAAREARNDGARLMVAPLERQVRQLADRIALIDGGEGDKGADPGDDWDSGRSRSGLFARLFEE